MWIPFTRLSSQACLELSRCNGDAVLQVQIIMFTKYAVEE